MARRAPFQREKLRLGRVPPLDDPRLTQWLEDLRNALEDLPYDFAPAFSLAKSTNQTLPTGATTDVTWQTIDRDQGFGLSGPVTTVTIPRTGWYVSGGSIAFAANATGVRVSLVDVGGTTRARDSKTAFATVNNQLALAGVLYLLKDDVVKVRGFQNSGGDLDIDSTNHTYWSLCWINPLENA